VSRLTLILLAAVMTAKLSVRAQHMNELCRVPMEHGLGRSALILLHECQHTVHVALCFAKRRNSVIPIHGAAPGIVRRDDVLQPCTSSSLRYARFSAATTRLRRAAGIADRLDRVE
jgi:hypothetical protein